MFAEKYSDVAKILRLSAPKCCFTVFCMHCRVLLQFSRLPAMEKAIYADNEARSEKKWFVQNAMIMMKKAKNIGKYVRVQGY